MTRAVVFAYSEVGVRCVRELLAQGVEIPLLFTHADDKRNWLEEGLVEKAKERFSVPVRHMVVE